MRNIWTFAIPPGGNWGGFDVWLDVSSQPSYNWHIYEVIRELPTHTLRERNHKTENTPKKLLVRFGVIHFKFAPYRRFCNPRKCGDARPYLRRPRLPSKPTVPSIRHHETY